MDMTTSYNVKVGYDGNIEYYENTINISKSTLDMIKSLSTIGGANSSKNSKEFNLENMGKELYPNLSQKYPNAKIKVKSYYDSNGNAIIYIKSNEAVVNENESINIIKSDDKMIYNHTFKGYGSESEGGVFLQGIKINYRLEMAGEIIDSNADKVDGRVAEWHTNAYELSKHGGCIYAISKIEYKKV